MDVVEPQFSCVGRKVVVRGADMGGRYCIVLVLCGVVIEMYFLFGGIYCN